MFVHYHSSKRDTPLNTFAESKSPFGHSSLAKAQTTAFLVILKVQYLNPRALWMGTHPVIASPGRLPVVVMTGRLLEATVMSNL